MKVDYFALGILGVVVLAYFFPEPAEQTDFSPVISVGVSLIFFFYGLKLNLQKLKEGLKNCRLHLLIQATTFLIFPLLALALKPLFASDENLWLAVFFFAALPSTVSSSVVMVSIAKGNMPAAIFNASISGLIGIVLTPLWLSDFVGSGISDFQEIYSKLLIEILIPLVLGLFLHKMLGAFVQKYSNFFTNFDRAVILLIIYNSFVHSFGEDIFFTINLKSFLLLVATVIGLFLLVYSLINWFCRFLGFNREDRITALFCGTKKSLVHGTVFSKVLFAGSPIIGIILLPIMLYHLFQILVISAVAGKMGRSL